MPDIGPKTSSLDDEMSKVLADALEGRAAAPSQKTMLQNYLTEMNFRDQAKVLEIGCGTGPVSRLIAKLQNVAQVTDIDPSNYFIEKAKKLAAENTKYPLRGW